MDLNLQRNTKSTRSAGPDPKNCSPLPRGALLIKSPSDLLHVGAWGTSTRTRKPRARAAGGCSRVRSSSRSGCLTRSRKSSKALSRRTETCKTGRTRMWWRRQPRWQFLEVQAQPLNAASERVGAKRWCSDACAHRRNPHALQAYGHVPRASCGDSRRPARAAARSCAAPCWHSSVLRVMCVHACAHACAEPLRPPCSRMRDLPRSQKNSSPI